MPPRDLAERVERLMQRHAVSWRRTTGGYTTAERWIVTFADGRSCFVKSGAGHLAEFLRAEFRLVYSRLEAPFLAKLIAWEDDGVAPILVLEDLSSAHWPPPWSPAQVRAVLEALDDLQAFSGDLGDLPGVETHTRLSLRDNWQAIERDPAPFLSLGLCTERWLTAALPVLDSAARKAPLEGDDVLHLDVRSDNLCFAGDRVVLLDWNHVCRGNRALDVAAWLPSLQAEGGPAPEDVADLAPEWAAVVAGYFAAQAGLPPIPEAPAVREVQLSQLRAALPWAQRALGLAPLDGPNAADTAG